MDRTLIALLTCFSFFLNGCGTRAKLPSEKVYFVNSKTEKAINSVLVIPFYYESSSSGIGFFKGEEVVSGIGTSGGYSGYAYAHPFICYSSDLTFIIEQPSSICIVVPGVLAAGTGKDLDVEGVLVIAKGYEPKYIEQRFFFEDRLRPLKFELEPLKLKESREVLFKLSNGILNKDCEVFWQSEYLPEKPKDCNLKCEFSEKDWKLIEDFVADAQADLNRK
jgi:hypothetical protein